MKGPQALVPLGGAAPPWHRAPRAAPAPGTWGWARDRQGTGQRGREETPLLLAGHGLPPVKAEKPQPLAIAPYPPQGGVGPPRAHAPPGQARPPAQGAASKPLHSTAPPRLGLGSSQDHPGARTGACKHGAGAALFTQHIPQAPRSRQAGPARRARPGPASTGGAAQAGSLVAQPGQGVSRVWETWEQGPPPPHPVSQLPGRAEKLGRAGPGTVPYAGSRQELLGRDRLSVEPGAGPKPCQPPDPPKGDGCHVRILPSAPTRGQPQARAPAGQGKHAGAAPSSPQPPQHGPACSPGDTSPEDAAPGSRLNTGQQTGLQQHSWRVGPALPPAKITFCRAGARADAVLTWLQK